MNAIMFLPRNDADGSHLSQTAGIFEGNVEVRYSKIMVKYGEDWFLCDKNHFKIW